MTGFLVFTGIIAIIVILFRYWRKREVQAFLETDMSALEQMNLAGDERISQSEIASFPSVDSAEKVDAQKESPVSTFHLREEIFDDVHRGCLKALDEVIDERQRLFVHVPLNDLIHSDEKPERDRLKGVTLSFLLCDRDTLRVICGIQLKGQGVSELDKHEFVEDVFRQASKPLITLPMRTTWSPLELQEALADVLEHTASSRHCPRCGEEMIMRQAVKGKNAGKNFWVCKEFPSCRGIMRIGRS